MSFYNLFLKLEKEGVLDVTVTGHLVDRPPEVKKGEAADRQGRFSIKSHWKTHQSIPPLTPLQAGRGASGLLRLQAKPSQCEKCQSHKSGWVNRVQDAEGV